MPMGSESGKDASMGMTPSDDDRLAAIRARLGAATPGPWRYQPGGREPLGQWSTILLEEGLLQGLVLAEVANKSWGQGSYNPANAAFIAAAPDDVRWLLAEVERLRADYATVTAEMKRYRKLALKDNEEKDDDGR